MLLGFRLIQRTAGHVLLERASLGTLQTVLIPRREGLSEGVLQTILAKARVGAKAFRKLLRRPPPIKVCGSCHNSYTKETWAALTLLGTMGEEGAVLELRNCANCCSTITIPRG